MLVFIQRKLDLCGGVTAEKFRHFRDSRIFDLFDLSISKKNVTAQSMATVKYFGLYSK